MLGQASKRGCTKLLFVLTARNCHGCITLKEQLKDNSSVLQDTLVVLAEGGDLRGKCFFGIEIDALALQAPGLPTSYLFEAVEGGFALKAAALGPFKESSSRNQLVVFMDGESYLCEDARGAVIKVITPAGQEARSVDNLPPILLGL